MWKLFFKKKEKSMAATNESKNSIQLKKTIAKQGDSLNRALNRISALTDEISSLRNELKKFKQDVASDVKYLTEKVGG
tara:strand:+ start:602 stop:835 length:234 start_codon:yes stop_codon:yes gene_type:complete